MKQANTGKMNYGGLGIGQSGHLSMELLKTLTGIDVVYAPYKSVGFVVTDLLAGRLLAHALLAPIALARCCVARIRIAVTPAARRADTEHAALRHGNFA